MATEIEPDVSKAEDSGEPVNFLNCSSGFLSWALTLDHKRIGIMYLIGVSCSALLGGIFALIFRTELMFTRGAFLSDDLYNQLFTLHGAIMVFLFIIPGIPAALGNIILPIMLGAKDVAFPRMNLGSFYLWMGGLFFFIAVLVTGGLDTGWTLYTPYSSSVSSSSVILATLGAFILGFSSIFTGLNFIVTIHTMRPPGMTWFRMPLFLWALYSTAIIQVLATPVLGITLLLLCMERWLGLGIFDPRLGGDPVLFQHFFWFYSHPAVYIMIVPGMGVASELISTFSRKQIFGYRFIAYSSISLALLGFLVWGHHMFVSGQSTMAAILFSGLTYSVSIPTAIKVFNWVSTMYKGAIRFTTPMCYGISFVFLFTIGGLTGLPLGSLLTDVQLHDTYYVVAHFHYTMMGGTLIAFVGGVYYWWPKFTGKMFSNYYGNIACLMVFIGFNATFFPQFIMGSRGMPRRYHFVPEEFQGFHIASTIGAYFLGIGLFFATGVLLYSLKYGRKAPGNPWGSATLEWACPSPPTQFNFEETPQVTDPYDLDIIEYIDEENGYVRNLDKVSESKGH